MLSGIICAGLSSINASRKSDRFFPIGLELGWTLRLHRWGTFSDPRYLEREGMGSGLPLAWNQPETILLVSNLVIAWHKTKWPQKAFGISTPYRRYRLYGVFAIHAAHPSEFSLKEIYSARLCIFSADKNSSLDFFLDPDGTIKLQVCRLLHLIRASNRHLRL